MKHVSERDSRKEDKRARALSRHNLGSYDVFWNDLLWMYLDSLQDLLSIRYLMSGTRHVKGNVAHQTPIGKFTFAQFLQVNIVPNPAMVMFAADGPPAYCSAVQDFLALLDSRPLGVFIPATVIFYKMLNTQNHNVDCSFEQNISCAHISSETVVTTWHPTPATNLKLVIDIESSKTYRVLVNHPDVQLACRSSRDSFHSIDMSITHKSNADMYISLISPHACILLKTNASRMSIKDFTHVKYQILHSPMLQFLTLWVEENSYEDTDVFQTQCCFDLPYVNVEFVRTVQIFN